MKKQRIALTVWKDSVGAFERIGAGKDYTEQNDASGSFKLTFRAIQTEPSIDIAYSGSGDPQLGCIALYVWLGYDGAVQMEFNLHATGYLDTRTAEATLKVMKQWEARAAKLYTGGVESFDTKLRRMIAATGAKEAIAIGGFWGSARQNSLLKIEEAILSYVMPAVSQVRSKLKKHEPEQQDAA